MENSQGNRKFKPHLQEYDQVDIYDLLNDESSLYKVNRNFGSWEELIGNLVEGKTKHYKRSRKSLRQKVVTEVVYAFLDRMMKDVIYHNETFVFPYNSFAKLTIGINYDFDSPNYRFNIMTEGLNFAPRILLSNYSYKKIGKMYYTRFTRRWRKRLYIEIDNGHRYAPQKKIKYELRQL